MKQNKNEFIEINPDLDLLKKWFNIVQHHIKVGNSEYFIYIDGRGGQFDKIDKFTYTQLKNDLSEAQIDLGNIDNFCAASLYIRHEDNLEHSETLGNAQKDYSEISQFLNTTNSLQSIDLVKNSSKRLSINNPEIINWIIQQLKSEFGWSSERDYFSYPGEMIIEKDNIGGKSYFTTYQIEIAERLNSFIEQIDKKLSERKRSLLIGKILIYSGIPLKNKTGKTIEDYEDIIANTKSILKRKSKKISLKKKL